MALPNGIGVIDADYYNNPNNEGELFVQVLNYGVRPLHIKKGDRIEFSQNLNAKYLESQYLQPPQYHNLH